VTSTHHKDALTNELTVRRFGLMFNRMMNLPDCPYHLKAYEERRTKTDTSIFLKFTTDQKLSVIVQLTGPTTEQKDADFGLYLDQHSTAPRERIGDEEVVVLKGYLRPYLSPT
jgi:hypothetical protein